MSEQQKYSHLPVDMLEGLQTLQEQMMAYEETARGLRDHLTEKDWHPMIAQMVAGQMLDTMVKATLGKMFE